MLTGWMWGPRGRQEPRMLAGATPGLHPILPKMKAASRLGAESEVGGRGPVKQEMPWGLKAA